MATTGRDAEFTEFMRVGSASLTRTAWLLTGDHHLAAELVQEALVKTYLAWRRVRPGEGLAYSRRILVNLNIDRLRRRLPTPTSEVDRPVAGSEGTVEDRDQVMRLLTGLPPRQRRVVVLRYYHDLSEADVAQMLGISIGAVKSAASRGLASLRTAEPASLKGERA